MRRAEYNLAMGRFSGKRSWAYWAVLLACVIPAGQRSSSSRAEAPTLDALIIHRSRTTGRATFVTARDGKAIWTSSGVTADADRPMSFLRDRGRLFGITEPARELAWQRVTMDRHGGLHTTYEQVFHGVPVFAGVIKVHQNSKSEVVAANGDFFRIKPQLDTTPGIAPGEAVTIAADAVDCGDMIVEKAELVIVDPGWYGDPPIGEHLAYHVILQGAGTIVREAFFVDAKTGRILDQWNLTESARFRASYNGNWSIGLPGINPRFEGDPPVVLPIEQNYAYDWAGDAYRYFFNAFGYDSIDGEGMDIVLTVSHWRPDFCPNAFWNGRQSVFCAGTVTDDVLAHEMGHGINDYTADLIYQNQSGQLNESYSDVWGEMVDLFNGDAAFFGAPGGLHPWPISPSSSVDTDEPNWKRTTCPSTGDTSVRWLIAEDAAAFGGFIRDMWDPTCSFIPDPPSATHNLYLRTCSVIDNGGVHIGSGVPNHAFAMLVDGKTYDNISVAPIGPIKAAAIWFRALTVYLTPASDFLDAYWALNQSAADLVGTFPFDPRTGEIMTFPSSQFTQNDAAQVDKALRAVAMDVEGLCGETTDVLDPNPPDLCDPRQTIYAITFDLGAPGWTVFNSAPRTEYDWELVGDLPFDRPGTAYFCADLDSNCSAGNESGTHTLMSPAILLPARLDRPTLQFSHYMSSEVGWDGGVLRIRVNDGPFTLVPPTVISYNRYNMTLIAGDNTNPLAGLPAWSGSGGQWGTTVVDLTTLVSPGDTVQFQFQFGKDRCTGVDGWYVDDVFISTCICGSDAHCTDGEFCNGEETCVDGFCQRGVDPCLFGFCDEEEDFCDLIAFFEDFEPGSPHDWELDGPDDTATTGPWFIGIPNGTIDNEEQAQPASAYQGLLCAFTSLNESAGSGDVDKGAVYLTSPAIDLIGAPAAELSYVRWFYNRSIGAEPDDWFRVDASDDDGATWTNIETIRYDAPLANMWTPRTFRLDDAIDMVGAVRIRFSASDGPNRNNIIEAAVDNVQVLVVGECESDADCDDGDVCTIDTCSALKCHHEPITCVTITAAFPASGSIDARQPHEVNDATQVAGWTEVILLYQGPGSLQLGDFTLTEVGGDGVAPVVVAVTPFGPTVAGLTFSEPIEPGAWTVVTHDPTGWQTCLGFLPADVNGDRLASTGDIGVLIDAINGVLPAALPDHAVDIDRSGVISGQDILRLIDLLNGASEFEVWHTKSLPANPCN